MKKYILSFLTFIIFFPLEGQGLILTGKGYDMHTELEWNNLAAADRYRVWVKKENENQFSILTSTKTLRWQDWTGRVDQQAHTYQYYIDALSVPGTVLASSDTIETNVSPFSDEQFLDMVQEYTFRYFYEYAHPTSGMARERLGSGDIVTTGGTGFGVMALIVGVHRGFITREQGIDRMLKIVGFLQIADRFHGVFPHWMNGKNGNVIPFSSFDNGGDLVETAFLMQGLLCAREFFNEDEEKENVLREVITDFWEDVEWDFYSKNNSGVLYWHWSPNFAWQMNFPLRGYNEGLIVYLLAIASPTHPVPASYWHTGWAGSGYVNGNTWYGHKLFLGPHFGGPQFFAHYSYMGFDPRNIKDAYANYFEQNRNHTLINRGWCVANPLHHEGYNAQSWGLTASDNPWGYFAHAPGANTDNGTLTPAAAIPSMPYTPAESISVLKHFYREYGENLWGQYGFYDAFNPGENWYADSYLAIDQGPIINMIENYRSGLLWSHFMTNPEIAPAIEAIGFEEDLVSTEDQISIQPRWKVFPTISHGDIYILLDDGFELNNYTFTITDAIGRQVIYQKSKVVDGVIQLTLTEKSSFSGFVWVSLSDQYNLLGTLPVWIQ